MSRLAAGLSSVEFSNNEEVDQTAYLDGEGFSSSDVTGGQMILSFSGHRDYDDAAQNYIYSLLTEFGESRKTNFEWTTPNGDEFTGNITIANIEGPSGDANTKGEISFEIHFNGKPVFTPAPVTP
ncbi:MAG: capsid protein [Niallia sp.]